MRLPLSPPAFPPVPADPNHDRIVALLSDGSVRTLVIASAEVSIGSALGNELTLNEQGVAAQHARIRFDGVGFRVTDLNSQAGTYMGNTRLLPGVASEWPPGVALRIGPCWLRLERAAKAPGQPPLSGTVVSTAPAPQRVGVFLRASSLSIEPGAAAALDVTIVNQGSVVDHFQVTAPDLPAGWLVVPPLLRLLPGAQQQVTVVLQHLPLLPARGQPGRAQ